MSYATIVSISAPLYWALLKGARQDFVMNLCSLHSRIVHSRNLIYEPSGHWLTSIR